MTGMYVCILKGMYAMNANELVPRSEHHSTVYYVITLQSGLTCPWFTDQHTQHTFADMRLFLDMHFAVWWCYLQVSSCNMMNASKVHGNEFYCITFCLLISSASSRVFQMWSICAPFSRRTQTLPFSHIWRSWTVRLCLCQHYLRDPSSSPEYVSDSEVKGNLVFCYRRLSSCVCNSCF